MASSSKRTVSLPTEHSSYLDRLIASGRYASASEVVRAGLRALQERDAVIEKWLQSEVAPVYDAMQKEPDRAIPSGAVFDGLRARRRRRQKAPR